MESQFPGAGIWLLSEEGLDLILIQFRTFSGGGHSPQQLLKATQLPQAKHSHNLILQSFWSLILASLVIVIMS